MKILLSILFTIITGHFYGQDLVYKAKNPAFGGDTFNYQWMLSSAESQNLYKEKTEPRKEKTQLEQFTENLNSQLLNQIAQSLFEEQFGTDGISEGVFNFGSLSVEIFPSNLGLVVSILDTTTGEQTQVIIPNN
ncbi:curli production assembly/transport component CsgF [Flavobacterium sp.]|uniref:curli production assembly/transport component CsgF n=1 Tax=Flavobacterium sp. TaxID=239 RepID=UPI003D6B6ED5